MRADKVKLPEICGKLVRRRVALTIHSGALKKTAPGLIPCATRYVVRATLWMGEHVSLATSGEYCVFWVRHVWVLVALTSRVVCPGGSIVWQLTYRRQEEWVVVGLTLRRYGRPS